MSLLCIAYRSTYTALLGRASYDVISETHERSIQHVKKVLSCLVKTKYCGSDQMTYSE
jgi:hypothetical protein